MILKLKLKLSKFCLVLATLVSQCKSQTPTSPPIKTPLYIGAFFPFGGGWDGSGVIPVVEMALDDINSRQDILPGYELMMVWNDTQCEAGLGTRVLFDQIFSKPQKLMLLGGGCSTATQAIAGTAFHWNMVTMSYAASSSALSNREVYPFFYRTYMPDAMYNPARIRLMRDYNWTRIATIHENHELFSLAIDDLHNILTHRNITLISSESFAENPHNQVVNLKNQDAKIIVSNMYESKARRVFCEAFKQGMTAKNGYVWLLIGWYSDKWWEVEDVSCNQTEMREAVYGYISVESVQLGDPNVLTVANITSADYETRLKERLKWPQYDTYEWNTLAPYGYDAAWAIALMLNKTANDLKTKTFSDNSTRRLEDFNYDDREMAQMFVDNLNETNFIGVTGPVTFKHGDRVGISQIEQLQVVCEDGWYLYNYNCYRLNMSIVSWSEAASLCRESGADIAQLNTKIKQNMINIYGNQDISQAWIGRSSNTTCVIAVGDCPAVNLMTNVKCNQVPCISKMPFICQKEGDLNERRIGLYNAINDDLQWLSSILWPGDQVPLDHTTDMYIAKGISLTVFVAFTIIACVGIILALICLAFNLKFRQQRSVRLSSPYLNNLIILGSLIIYIWIILYGISTDFVSDRIYWNVCQFRHWFLSVGFILGYGAIFSKTWRVYRVATFKKPKRVIVSDNHLLLMVLAFLCFDVLLLTVWQLANPLSVQRFNSSPTNVPDVPNQIFYYHDYCYSMNYGYWLAAVAGYKGLLLLFGAFLAWETRKVTIAELNDSKLIGISVYTVVILCVVGVAVSTTISSNAQLSYMFLSCIVLFCTFMTLIIIFVPKMIGVYKNPSGRNVGTHGTGSAPNVTSGDHSLEYSLREQIRKLQEELRESKQHNFASTQRSNHERSDMRNGTKDTNDMNKNDAKNNVNCENIATKNMSNGDASCNRV